MSRKDYAVFREKEGAALKAIDITGVANARLVDRAVEKAAGLRVDWYRARGNSPEEAITRASHKEIILSIIKFLLWPINLF